MEKAFWRACCPVATILLCTIFLVRGETFYVSVDGSGFSPASLPIHVGDTVVWENVDDFDFPHTATSTLDIFDPNYWNGTMTGNGDTFPWTFNNAGTLDYADQVDVGTGTIIVSPAVTTPAINLESQRIEGGQFLFEATGLTVGKTNVLFASTNLSSWLPVVTNVADNAISTLTNSVAAGYWFYRVAELPFVVIPRTRWRWKHRGLGPAVTHVHSGLCQAGGLTQF
jgi:plastocyanin